MSGYLVLAVVLVGLSVFYQIYITRRVVRATDYTDQQRLLQIIMIWALPVIGAALCQAMLGKSEAAEATSPDEHSDVDGAADD